MTEQQNSIAGVLAGMQLAILHLANTVGRCAGITPDALAKSFEETGETIPPELSTRAVQQMVLRQIAAGIRSSDGRPVPDNLILGAFAKTPGTD